MRPEDNTHAIDSTGDAQSAPPPETTAQIMTAEETAALLRVNKKTVYALFASGDLPGRRMGRLVRFHRDTVLRWLVDGQPLPPKGGTSR